MTDKQLQEILRTESVKTYESIEKKDSRLSDAEFTKAVMRQLPKTESALGVVWLIRLLALLLGIVILLPFHRVCASMFTVFAEAFSSYIQYIVSYGIFMVSPIAIALYGILFAGVIIVVCKKKHIV